MQPVECRIEELTLEDLGCLSADNCPELAREPSRD